MTDTEIVWHGATWRTFPPPVVLSEPAGQFQPRVSTGETADEVVRRLLSDVWQTTAEITAQAQRRGDAIRVALGRAVLDGVAEVTMDRRAGRTPRRYRRRHG